MVDHGVGVDDIQFFVAGFFWSCKFKFIDSAYAHEAEGCLFVNPCGCFELIIPVIGPDRKINGFKQQLKVTPADGSQVSCFFRKRAIQGNGQLGGTEDDISLGFVTVAGFLLELKYTAEGIVIPGIKRTGIHLYLFDKVGIENALRPTSTSLCTKMIDDRDFNAVQVVYIFTGCTTSDDDIVPETATANASANTRKGLDYLADIKVPTGVSLDFFGGHALNTQWGFQACGPCCVSSVEDDNLIKIFGFRLQLYAQCCFIA